MSVVFSSLATISKLLRKTNLTPKERYVIVIADLASKERDGKTILTKAKKDAIVNNWQPATVDEAEEFNRYNQAWKLTITAELEASNHYLEAKSKMQDLALFLTSIKDGALTPFAFLGEPYRSIKINEAEARDKIADAIKGTGNQLADAYATLLTYKKLFDDISDFYGVDLSYMIRRFIAQTKLLIDAYNNPPFGKYGLWPIDINTIEPKAGAVDLYRENIFKLLKKPK